MSAHTNGVATPSVHEIPKREKTEKPERKPTKTLPTDRINPPKQLDILRAYAAASNNGTKPATVNEVAEIVKMAPSTVALVNAFFSSIQVLQRADTGAYTPSGDVIAL